MYYIGVQEWLSGRMFKLAIDFGNRCGTLGGVDESCSLNVRRRIWHTHGTNIERCGHTAMRLGSIRTWSPSEGRIS